MEKKKIKKLLKKAYENNKKTMMSFSKALKDSTPAELKKLGDD